ncbi:MAG: hypothetical protein QCH31_03065 [Methanolobus sp.]|nr:hypothetical protein [Methanolobus sp.]
MKDDDFSEVMRKGALFGIGLWALTEEKIQDIADELIENGEIKKEEGKRFVREIIEEQKKQKEDMESKISTRIHETFGKADIATKEEVKELKDIIRQLEEKIDKLSASDDSEKEV